MSSQHALFVAACTWLLLGCSRHDPNPARNIDPLTPHRPSLLERPPPPVAAAPGSAVVAEDRADAGASRRQSCQRDADCLLSCRHGAVNASWYHAALPNGEACQDGCASKGLTASCAAGRCVAKKNGALVPECTGLTTPVTNAQRAE